MAHQQSSELLRVLGQLDGATSAETLLPLLRADESAGAAALACKQLRQLCQDNQRELKLTGANCQHLGPLEVDAFNRPFPACSSVVFTASSTNDFAYRLTRVVPLLARLPKLQSLQLNISSSTASQPDRMAPALQLLRVQLPQLRSLQLELCGSWASDSQEAWAVLGAATQLTKLVMNFDDQPDDPGLSLQHLSALQALGSGLQHLTLTASVANIANSQNCSFLSSFSGLTSLKMPLIKRSGLAAISSCTALQQLWLVDYGDFALDAAECAALAQLTRLTLLDIPAALETPDILAALRCLSGLQGLGLQDMSSSHLPVLATLTKLTCLAGSWVDTPTEPTDQQSPTVAGASQHACPCVVKVVLSGPFLLAAFPGAKQLEIRDTWQPSRLASLGQHMKALEALGIGLSNKTSTFRSLDPSAPEAERVAAVRSLGQLGQLTELQFALNDDAEAAVLATACRGVNKLWLGVPHGSSVTALGLSSGLCSASLHELTLSLPGLQLPQSDARLLLAGLSSGVRELTVAAATREQLEVWEAAAEAARAAGLPLPAACEVSLTD